MSGLNLLADADLYNRHVTSISPPSTRPTRMSTVAASSSSSGEKGREQTIERVGEREGREDGEVQGYDAQAYCLTGQICNKKEFVYLQVL
jgi:hypothetical protein